MRQAQSLTQFCIRMPQNILERAQAEAEKLECDRASVMRFWLYQGFNKLERDGGMPKAFLKSLPLSERKW